MENTDAPKQEVNLERLKEEKLLLEVAVLKSPFRRNPALWIMAATTVVTAAACMAQLIVSKHEFILNENRSVLAEIELKRTVLELDRKQEGLDELTRRYTRVSQDLAASEARVAASEARVTTLESQRHVLKVENARLLRASYVNSANKEAILLPPKILFGASPTVDGELKWHAWGTNTFETEFTLRESEKPADPYGVGSSTFTYASDNARVVFTREDVTDWVLWTMQLDYSLDSDSNRVELHAEGTGDDHDMVYPFFEKAILRKQGETQSYQLSWYPVWE